MRNNRAPAFAHDRRMRDAFGIAHVHDVPDNVVGVFLERIIRRAVEIAARSIVIDAKTAADVEITELVSELAKLCVIARRFAHRALDRRNVRHLRSDMEMNELEAMRQTGVFQHLTCSNEIGRVETELRVLAAARRPFAGAFAVQAHANADVRFDADFFRSANGLLKLFQFFDDNDDRFAEFAAKQRNANESGIFVAVADDQALRVLVHGERGDQFRFAAGFEPEVKLLAGIDNLFDDFAQLIDLDRENAAILIAITELQTSRFEMRD